MLDKFTGKSRGFAFVEFANDADAAKAVEMFHNKDFQGRALTVNIARPREDRPPASAAAGTTAAAITAPAVNRGRIISIGPVGVSRRPVFLCSNRSRPRRRPSSSILRLDFLSGFASRFGLRRQSEAATPLWIQCPHPTSRTHPILARIDPKAPSPLRSAAHSILRSASPRFTSLHERSIIPLR